MPLDETRVRDFDFADVPVKVREKDAMLYALGLGIGADPLDARALRHVYEKDLQVFPTMPLVLGSPGIARFVTANMRRRSNLRRRLVERIRRLRPRPPKNDARG